MFVKPLRPRRRFSLPSVLPVSHSRSPKGPIPAA